MSLCHYSNLCFYHARRKCVSRVPVKTKMLRMHIWKMCFSVRLSPRTPKRRQHLQQAVLRMYTTDASTMLQYRCIALILRRTHTSLSWSGCGSSFKLLECALTFKVSYFYDTEVIHVRELSHFTVTSAEGHRAPLLSALYQQGRYLSAKGRHLRRAGAPRLT